MKALPLLLLLFLTGCQTAQVASTALDTAGAIRNEVAKKETEVNLQRLCASNFNVIRDKFGKTDQEWNAILVICESANNSVLRNPADR